MRAWLGLCGLVFTGLARADGGGVVANDPRMHPRRPPIQSPGAGRSAAAERLFGTLFFRHLRRREECPPVPASKERRNNAAGGDIVPSIVSVLHGSFTAPKLKENLYVISLGECGAPTTSAASASSSPAITTRKSRWFLLTQPAQPFACSTSTAMASTNSSRFRLLASVVPAPRRLPPCYTLPGYLAQAAPMARDLRELHKAPTRQVAWESRLGAGTTLARSRNRDEFVDAIAVDVEHANGCAGWVGETSAIFSS